jgi:hypothetical protein
VQQLNWQSQSSSPNVDDSKFACNNIICDSWVASSVAALERVAHFGEMFGANVNDHEQKVRVHPASPA